MKGAKAIKDAAWVAGYGDAIKDICRSNHLCPGHDLTEPKRMNCDCPCHVLRAYLRLWTRDR
jgi:hypothetical protein